MSLDLEESIAAIATAPGGAWRGVIRVSGMQAVTVVSHVLRHDEATAVCQLTRPHALSVRLELGDGGSTLPAELLVWPARRSYTGEPLVEIHTLGSPPLLERTLTALTQAGARLARPGEFTLRAFLAGRLDLTQAEAVLGVIDAHDRREFQVALKQLSGGLAVPLTALRARLLDLLADLEAGLDFAEEDLDLIERGALREQLAAAAEEVERLVRQIDLRGVCDSEPRVVLVGPPNAGKSCLFNALLGRPAAIVSPIAGTTRDFVTGCLEWPDLICRLVDTAGREEDATGIAAAAQGQAGAQLAQADLVLECVPADQPRCATASAASDALSRLWVITKCDAAPQTAAQGPTGGALETSAVTGAGIANLRQAIRAVLLDRQGRSADVVATTALRCGASLRSAAEALARAAALAAGELGDELIAAEVRQALTELGLVAGVVHTDDLLDRIFSRFCIGK